MIKKSDCETRYFPDFPEFFYLQACDSGNTGATSPTVDSFHPKKRD
jgi:hypothetical protein